jgi:hypothetical protein
MLVKEAALSVIAAARSYAATSGAETCSKAMTSQLPYASHVKQKLDVNKVCNARLTSALPMSAMQSSGLGCTSFSTFAHAVCACISTPCAGSGLSHQEPIVLKAPEVAATLAGDPRQVLPPNDLD